MNVFVREAPIEENTASKFIRAVAATYGCKILQLYEYETNEYGDTKRTANDTHEYQFMHHKTVDYRAEVVLHGLSSTCFKIKIITIFVLFYKDKTIDQTSYPYRRLPRVNQSQGLSPAASLAPGDGYV